MKFNSFILSASIVVFSACNHRPSNILSDKAMENILLDLYTAEAVIKKNCSQEQTLLHSVLEKYHISEQTFDTSLVWYNAHLDKFIKINKQLTVRYTFLIENLKATQKELQAKSQQDLDTLFPHFPFIWWDTIFIHQ